jgi:hypothetical protein
MYFTLKRTLFLTSCVMAGALHAQVAGFPTGPGSEGKTTLDSANNLILQPFKYIAPANAEAQAAKNDKPPRPPAQQQVVDLNAAGDYQAAGTQGLALLATEKVDDELQLIIANSLAWTGRVKEAIPTYQAISGGPVGNAATVGLANINRWQGRDDLALPMYRKVLDTEPTNDDALSGAAMASRGLAPKTTFRWGGAQDSSDLQRRSGSIAHQWRDASGANIYEVEAEGFRDWLPTAQAVQKDLTVRYKNLDTPLKPSLELSMTTELKPALYGVGRVTVLDDRMTLALGRVDWGKSSANPNASFVGTAANYAGAQFNQSFSMGSINAKADFYNISDGNTITTTGLTFNSAWRPLGSHFKPFVGAETRSAKFNAPNYWSPATGYGAAFAGLLGEWGEDNWNLFASAQLGAPLYGEAGHSWSVSAGGKYWLTQDIALGGNLWSMSSIRDGVAYRAKSLDVYLEKLWP